MKPGGDEACVRLSALCGIIYVWFPMARFAAPWAGLWGALSGLEGDSEQ